MEDPANTNGEADEQFDDTAVFRVAEKILFVSLDYEWQKSILENNLFAAAGRGWPFQ